MTQVVTDESGEASVGTPEGDLAPVGLNRSKRLEKACCCCFSVNPVARKGGGRLAGTAGYLRAANKPSHFRKDLKRACCLSTRRQSGRGKLGFEPFKPLLENFAVSAVRRRLMHRTRFNGPEVFDNCYSQQRSFESALRLCVSTFGCY
jgi:hypothetical protein